MLLPSWSNCSTESSMNLFIFDSELFKGQLRILLLTRYEYSWIFFDSQTKLVLKDTNLVNFGSLVLLVKFLQR